MNEFIVEKKMISLRYKCPQKVKGKSIKEFKKFNLDCYRGGGRVQVDSLTCNVLV